VTDGTSACCESINGTIALLQLEGSNGCIWIGSYVTDCEYFPGNFRIWKVVATITFDGLDWLFIIDVDIFDSTVASFRKIIPDPSNCFEALAGDIPLEWSGAPCNWGTVSISI
jgi:hypothetical protein